MPDRTKSLWLALSRAGRLRLIIAIFLTFAAVGFVTDLYNLRETPTPTTLAIKIAFTGLLSVGYFVAVTRSRWLLVPCLLLQIAGVMLIDRLPPAHVYARGIPIPLAVLQHRVSLDAFGILITIALAYSFFI